VNFVMAKIQKPVILPAINHHPYNAELLPSGGPGAHEIQSQVASAGNMEDKKILSIQNNYLYIFKSITYHDNIHHDSILSV
jgi:hypothetical protein